MFFYAAHRNFHLHNYYKCAGNKKIKKYITYRKKKKTEQPACVYLFAASSRGTKPIIIGGVMTFRR